MFVLGNSKAGICERDLTQVDQLPGCGHRYRYGHKLIFTEHFIIYKALSHTLLYNLIWEEKCYLYFIDEETKTYRV